jgi:hypothetical protein
MDPEGLEVVLIGAGFTFLSVQSISVTKKMTVEETVELILLTYLPDLLTPAALAQLKGRLKFGFAGIADAIGAIAFSESSDLVCARRS